MGRLRTQLPPMVFTVTHSISPLHGQDTKPRKILVQPTVDLERSGLLLPPIAVWRGLGTDKAGGHPAAMLALITQHVTKTFSDVLDHGTDQTPFTWHTYLSLHHVNINPPLLRPQGNSNAGTAARPAGPAAKRIKSSVTTPARSSPPAAQPSKFSYVEYFAFTVCSASIPIVQECFAGLFPGGGLDSTHGTISYPGWNGQVATDLAIFRTLAGAVPPAPELLIPQPVTIILDALAAGQQDTSAIHYAYLQRGSDAQNPDSCIFNTTGIRYRMATHLRQCATGTPLYADDLNELKTLRTYYSRIRDAMGCPAPPPPKARSGPPVPHIRAQPTTYAQVTRDGPGPTLSLTITNLRSQITREIHQQVEEAHTHLQSSVDASLRSMQAQLDKQTQAANEALQRADQLHIQFTEQMRTQSTLQGMLEVSLATLRAMNQNGPVLNILPSASSTSLQPQGANTTPPSNPLHPHDQAQQDY